MGKDRDNMDVATEIAGLRQPLPAPATDDDALAVRAAGDPRAFAALYRRHLPRVYAYCRARLGSQADAEDVTSQTFIAAWEGLAGYQRRGKFVAWLLAIAHHKVIDHYRAHKPTLPLESAGPLATGLPHAEIEGRLRDAAVVDALQRIAPERAEALALRLFAGLSTAEAAAVLGKSQPAVKMLVHRGLRDLRRQLAGPEQDNRSDSDDTQP